LPAAKGGFDDVDPGSSKHALKASSVLRGIVARMGLPTLGAGTTPEEIVPGIPIFG